MSPQQTSISLDSDLLVERLSDCKPIFILPRDNVAEDIISPAMAVSSEVSIMMGFFSSASLAEIAPGLAIFLNNTKETLRLVISPFISEADQVALRDGSTDADSLADRSFGQLLPNSDELEKHTLRCLSWLISSGRLEIRIALMRDALFHSKVWHFKNGSSEAVLHGSANMTNRGLRGNREQLALARNWMSVEASDTCKELYVEFESLWSGGDVDCVTVPLSEATKNNLLEEFKGETPPTEHEFSHLWRRAHGLSDEPINVDELLTFEKSRDFSIPEWLEFKTGNFKHQGLAIDAWFSHGCRGILEMCTGSGKTLTAMIGAQLLYKKEGALLIVVSAPYNVLVSQWCEEIKLFGLRPINLSKANGPKGRARELSDARRRIRKNVSKCEAIVLSNDLLCTSDFQYEISKFECGKLLIADECHNLGSEQFISNPPDFFDWRLGLSATPMRQYDEEGTDLLFEYFGSPCFSYSLEEAIGTCLTPYEYHVTFVELENEKLIEWKEVSEKIRRISWKKDAGESDEYLNSLYIKRRRILETAGSKIELLRDLLEKRGPRSLKYTLIYATDKDPEQLLQVNQTLSSLGVLYHQLTADETATPKKAQNIISSFQDGNLQVLTAKRVLDEGVNIPQIERAYILASTTVRRQWVQRRGRLLRTCKEIGKEYAVIHDFVTLPPSVASGDVTDEDEKSIVNSELDRVWEFARLSKNGAQPGGPFEVVEELRSMVGG
jgi:superfamily II DNA or RNA helicase